MEHFLTRVASHLGADVVDATGRQEFACLGALIAPHALPPALLDLK